MQMTFLTATIDRHLVYLPFCLLIDVDADGIHSRSVGGGEEELEQADLKLRFVMILSLKALKAKRTLTP